MKLLTKHEFKTRTFSKNKYLSSYQAQPADRREGGYTYTAITITITTITRLASSYHPQPSDRREDGYTYTAQH